MIQEHQNIITFFQWLECVQFLKLHNYAYHCSSPNIRVIRQACVHTRMYEFCICIPSLQVLFLGVWIRSRVIIKSRGSMAMCKCRHDAWDSRCTISSTPCSDPFLIKPSNSNAGSIGRSGSNKCWISHTRWDGNLLNLNKELNWYTAHCHCGWCRDEVLNLNSNGIKAKGSTGIVRESAVVLRSQQNELALGVNCIGAIYIFH